MFVFLMLIAFPKTLLEIMWHRGRRGGLMVRVLVSGSSDPGSGSGPGWGHCVVFLGKTLYSHGASLHPRCINGYRRNVGGNPAMD